jgi:hypothetical protein
MKTFSKAVGSKINLQKAVDFLYTNNEQTEKEYRKTIPFTITSKLRVNLTKEIKDLYNKNY